MREFDHKLSTTTLISVVYPLGPAAIILMPMIVGGVIDQFGFSEQQAGTIASLEGLGIVFSSLIASLWIRRVSWTRMLLIGFLAYAALNAISANLGAFIPLAVTRFLAGFAGGTVFAVVVAALGDNKEPDRAFGIGQAAQGVLMFAAFAAAPFVIEAYGVGGLFYMLAAAALVMLLTLLRFPSQGAERETAVGAAGEGSGNVALIWVGLLAGFVYYASLFGFWGFIERMGQAAGLPGRTIGLALGASQVAAIAGALAAAVASDRFGRTVPLAVALAGQLLVLWLLVGQFTTTVFYIGAGLYQALYILATAYQMGVIAKLDTQGHYLVMITAFQGLGAAVGPSVAAALISGSDYRGINLAAALGNVISIAMFFFIIYRSRQLME